MSLIHEALKKVERQRQVGTAPTLDSPQFRRRRPRWPWLMLLVLVFVLAGAWIWRAPLVHKARSVASLVVGSEKVGAGEQPAAQTTPRKQSPAPEAPGKTSASGQPQATANKSAGPAATAATKPAPAIEAQRTPRPAQAKDKPRQAAPGLAQQDQAKAPGSGVTKPVIAAPNTTDAPQPAAKPAAVGQLQKKGPPMYWELPYAQRRDIPDLSISMHMYTDKPADRFVIINGVRQVEGDTLPSGLKLISINPDSITLDKDGQQFQVPRQGSH